jgi:hypothetical protein
MSHVSKLLLQPEKGGSHG